MVNDELSYEPDAKYVKRGQGNFQFTTRTRTQKCNHTKFYQVDKRLNLHPNSLLQTNNDLQSINYSFYTYKDNRAKY